MMTQHADVLRSYGYSFACIFCPCCCVGSAEEVAFVYIRLMESFIPTGGYSRAKGRSFVVEYFACRLSPSSNWAGDSNKRLPVNVRVHVYM